ncbi:hypothetical protein HanPI659440_Chr05g0208711 [Helianthus annuus]|nr:hypothetical protein HanPI659440_Chr05g0208711 [Helianthus annuus]
MRIADEEQQAVDENSQIDTIEERLEISPFRTTTTNYRYHRRPINYFQQLVFVSQP